MKSRFCWMLFVFIICFDSLASGKGTDNSVQARKMFDYSYNLVFGPQGSTLHYNVNIIGILKAEGTIWYKGKKSKFIEPRYNSWNNGITEYWVDKKKKTVTVYDSDSPNKDSYLSKFTFFPDDYKYSLFENDEGYIIVLDAIRKVKGVQHLKAIVDKKTFIPKSLKIKVLWFWTTVRISKFKSGNIKDDIFIYPSSSYNQYKLYDKRGK